MTFAFFIPRSATATDFNDLLICDGRYQRSTDNHQTPKKFSSIREISRVSWLEISLFNQSIIEISGRSSLPKPTDPPHVAAVFLGRPATRCIAARLVPQPLLFED
jgi:hypothetical protein